MCGRFVLAKSGSELVTALRVDTEADDLPAPSFNIAPTAQVPIVLDSAKTEPPTRRLEAARWGLVPPWAKDLSIGAKAFNARSESVDSKPMFRHALAARRAVVPASGYYEWSAQGGVKLPFYIHSSDDQPLLFAALYEWWKNPSPPSSDVSPWVLSCTILTRDATATLAGIHDRMPLFVDAEDADAWLDPTTANVTDVLTAVVEASADVAAGLAFHEVGREVGNVRNDGPDLIAALR